MEELVSIYTLSCPITNAIKYVGVSINPEKRFKAHLIRKENTYKYSWIKGLKEKGLIPKMDILETVNRKECDFWEVYWIAQIRAWGFKLTNLTSGGEVKKNVSVETRNKIAAKNRGRKQSDEEIKNRVDAMKALRASPNYVAPIPTEIQKKRMSESAKLSFLKNPERKKFLRDINKGKKLSPEHCKKMSETRKGRRPHNWSESARNNLSVALKEMYEKHPERKKNIKVSALCRERGIASAKGRIPSEETKRKLSIAGMGKNKGKKRTEAHKLAVSQAQTGRKHTPEHIAKRVASLNKIGHFDKLKQVSISQRKPVIKKDSNGNIVAEFVSVREAAINEFGVKAKQLYSLISQYCIKRKSRNGFTWEYKKQLCH